MIAPFASTSWTVRTGMLLMVAGALLWAAIESIGMRLADRHDALQVVWLRYATHLALLVVIFAPRRGVGVVRTSRLPLQVVRGLLMLLMPLCFLAAVAVSEPAEVLSVFWITPLLTMALAAWLLRERVDAWLWPVVSGGWVGAVLLLRPDPGAIGIGAIPALGMAVCLSLYLVMTRMLRDESTVTNLVFTAACVLVPLALAVPAIWQAPTARTLALMAAIGLLGLGVLYIFDRATELAPVSAVTPMLYTQPVWIVIFAMLVDGTHAGSRVVLGGVVVMTVITTLLTASGWFRSRTVPGGTSSRTGFADVSSGLPVTTDMAESRQPRVR